MRRTGCAIATATIGGVLLLGLPAGAMKLPPYPTAQQIAGCAKAVTSHKTLTAKQVRLCRTAVWQTFGNDPCPTSATATVTLIDLGHDYRGVHGKAAHKWAIVAGRKALLIPPGKEITEDQIAALC